MTNLSIRPFEPTDAEYETVVGLVNAAWPDDPGSVEIWKINDATRNPDYLYQRFVGEVRDASGSPKIVAVGSCWESAWSHKPGKYGIDFCIEPDCEGQDYDELIYNHITQFLAQRDPAPVKFKSHMREDKVAQVAFLRRQGFEQTLYEPDSKLDVQAFDFAPYAGVVEKVIESGIDIATIAELQKRDDNWMQKVYDLENIIEQDIPDTDAPTPQPLEEYAKRFERPHIRTDAWFIALDGDDYVGMSTLWPQPVLKEQLGVGITGVLRSHRRRRIALALKLKTIEFAKNYGGKSIETGNEENNPMYALNMKLGFKPIPGWLTLEKKL